MSKWGGVIEKLEKVLALLDDVVVELKNENPDSQECAKVLEAWRTLDDITPKREER